MKLSEALQECTLALLRRIAESHSLPVRDDLLRAEISALILDQFSDASYVGDFCSRLPREEGQVLSYLSSHGWQGKAFLLERQFPGQTGGGAARPTCQSLLQKGLLFRTYGVIDGWRGEVYYVPEELRPALEPTTSSVPDGKWMVVAAAPEPYAADQRDVVADLFCLFSFLRRGDRRFQQGGLTKTDLNRLELESAGALSNREPGKADAHWRFLIRLCLAGGWIWRDGVSLRIGRSASRLMAESPVSIRQRLVERYLKERSLSDLADTGKFRLPTGSRQLDEPASRQMLLHHLEELVENRWVTETSFTAALRQVNPDFLREDYASLGAAVVDAIAEVDLQGADSWPLVEGEWIKHVLRGPLYWLGVVRWGKSATGEIVAFQFAPREPRETPPSEDPGFVTREDGSLLASMTDLAALFQIEPYLVLKESSVGHRAYRVTESSVQHGIDQGGSLAELLGLLSRTWGSAMPVDLLGRIRAWALSYGSLRLEGTVLLTSNSEDDLLTVYALPGVAICLGERAGPFSYRVLPNRYHQLLSALRDAGRPPMIEASAGSTRARSITGEKSFLRESLFAMLVLRSAFGQVELESGEEAQHALEAVLGPEECEEVSRRALDTARKLRSMGERGW